MDRADTTEQKQQREQPRSNRKKEPGQFRLDFLRRRTVTLSIEGNGIRVLMTRGNSVKSWTTIPFNPRFLRNGFVSDAFGLGQVLASALASKKITKGRLVCAMTGLQAITRVFTVPKLNKGNLEQVVNREARRLLPISAEANYIYWQLLEERPAQLAVFVLALPREPLQMLVDAIQAGGLKPSSMDLKPLALVRAVNKRNAVIVNGEGTSIDFLIVVDNVPVLVRSIYLGDEAATMDQIAARLMEEVTRGISFYNDINKENPLDPAVPIYITGEVATEPNLADNLAILTGRIVPPLQSPLRCPPNFPLAQFMVNIGLALKK